MQLTVTPLYAIALGLLLLALSLRVIGARRRLQVAFGDAGEISIQRRVRAHGNFIEYTPFTLLLILLAELQGGAPLLLHLLGAALLAGRLLHAWGVSHEPEDYRFRAAGMWLTVPTIFAACLANLWLYVQQAIGV